MRSCLIALTTSILLLLVLYIQPTYAAIEEAVTNKGTSESDLPSALDNSFFDDLPFEQRRQALREEVERKPQKAPSNKYS